MIQMALPILMFVREPDLSQSTLLTVGNKYQFERADDTSRRVLVANTSISMDNRSEMDLPSMSEPSQLALWSADGSIDLSDPAVFPKVERVEVRSRITHIREGKPYI